MNRRSFLKSAFGASGFVALGGCRSAWWYREPAQLKFGVISDIHITDEASTAKFRKALAYFRDEGVDAVMVCGDLSDWGLKSGLGYVAAAWQDVFPGGRAPDGREVVPLFCTGNHDYEGWWYGDMTLEMHALGYSEQEALVKLGMKKTWEEVFGEPFAPVRRRTVKGFDFISAEWHGLDRADAWFAANGKSLDPEKPFFFFTHAPLRGTTSCSRRDSREQYPEVKALHAMPNAVAFSGHCHWTFFDDRSIWQDGFTAIAVPSMSYTTIPKGYENGSDRRNGQSKLVMPRIQSRETLTEAQGYVVSVFADRLEVARRDFDADADIAPWVLPRPLGRVKPYGFDLREKTMPVPQFPEGAVLRTCTRNVETRNSRWTIAIRLDFPSANDGRTRAFDYEVEAVLADGSVALTKRYLSPSFHLPATREPAAMTFLVDTMELPEGKSYFLRVYPRNAFGVRGSPLASRPYREVPGKDRFDQALKPLMHAE